MLEMPVDGGVELSVLTRGECIQQVTCGDGTGDIVQNLFRVVLPVAEVRLAHIKVSAESPPSPGAAQVFPVGGELIKFCVAHGGQYGTGILGNSHPELRQFFNAWTQNSPHTVAQPFSDGGCFYDPAVGGFTGQDIDPGAAENDLVQRCHVFLFSNNSR